MGAWGPEPFENDEAMDFVGQVVGPDSRAVLELALQPAGEAGVAAPCTVLAAAELVAAARGHAHRELPGELRDWIADTQPTFSEDVALRCRELVRRIHDESELRDLWEEAGEDEAWLATLLDLDDRLGRAPTR